MNRERLNRHYKSHNSLNRSQICLRCFKRGHTRGKACGNNDPYVACGRCFRLNYFTVDCICNEFNTQHNLIDGMALRLSDANTPRMYIDIIIGNTTCPALIDTGSFRGKLNREAVSIVNEDRKIRGLKPLSHLQKFNIPIRRRRKEIILTFDIRSREKQMVTVGMEFLMKVGFSLTIDSVRINQRSPITSSSDSIDFLYNHVQGEQLRNWLEQENKPLYGAYKTNSQPTLEEEPRVIIENEYYTDDKNDILEIHPDEEDLQLMDF